MLGPLLFIIYLDGITKLLLHDGSCLLLYADDILLYRRIQHQEDYLLLQQDIATLELWLQQKYLQLNVTKCKYIVLTMKHHPIDPSHPLAIQGAPIERVFEKHHHIDWNSLTSLIGIASVNVTIYIVTELAVNGSLFGYLHSEKKRPSVDRSLVWASDVAQGVKHLHDNNIIHHDLKSANVLLTGGWVAKLCDFGTSRELIHTDTTEQTGTYRWMPPEIMRAAKARINKKCDLFSYGMILFKLFAHKIPYSDLDNRVDVSKSVTEGIHPPIPPTLPSYLHDLTKKCWEEGPYMRPSFDDFVKAFSVPKSE